MADLVNKDAIVRFLAGYEENLSGTPVENGTVYFALKPDPLNSSKTIGSIYVDANGKRILMSGESYAALDALGDKIVSKYIKAIELDGSAGSKGVLTYVKGDGSDVDITMPAAGVSTAGIITTGSQTLAGQKTFNGLIIPKGGSMVHQAVGTSGTAGYVKIAQLKITGNYQDMPIVMELVDRSRTGSCVLNIRFTNTNSNDPTLDSFTYQGTNYPCYLYKSATSTWDLYVRKGENYGNPTVVRYHKASYMSKVAVTWTDVHADSVPSGATIASLGGSVSHASKADSATKATQDGSGNNINTTYLRDLDFETGTSVFKIWGIKGNSSSGTVISVPAATDKIAGLVTTGAQLFAGTKSFQDFIYSGIASDTTSNAVRALWFMSGTTGKPVYSSGLTYNPSTKTLTVEKLNGLASKAIADENGKNIADTYISALDIYEHTGSSFKIVGYDGNSKENSIVALPIVTDGSKSTLVTTGTQTFAGAKTFTADITLSGANTNIQASGRSTSWHKGRDVALIKTTSYSGYNTAYSLKTTNGDWSVGVYSQNGLYWTYILDSNYNNNANTVTAQMTLDANGLLTTSSLKVKTNATIDETTSTKDLIVNQNALITNNLSIGGKNTSYDLYNEGTSYFKGIITLPNTAYIAQHQNASSNYTTAIKWLSGGVSANTYDPQIGHHNTGSSGGAMVLLPYATNVNPWSGSVGLYLGKGVLKLDGSPVVTQANHKTYLNDTYVNVDGDTMTGNLTVAKKDAAVKVDYGGNIMGILASVNRGLYDFTSEKWLIYSKASEDNATCIPTHLYLEDGLTVAGATTLNGVVTINAATTINNSLKITGITTLTNTLHLTNTTDATASADNNVALIIGDRSAEHIIFDGNEIMAKSNATTAGTLYLNNEDGLVKIGKGGLVVSGGDRKGKIESYEMYAYDRISIGVYNNNYNFYNNGTSYFVEAATHESVINTAANKYDDAHTGALNLRNSNIFGVNAIFMCDLSDSPAEGIHFYRTSTTVDTLWINNGLIYFTPNRTLGQDGISYVVPRTSTTNGTVGATEKPVYVDAGTIKAMSTTIGGTAKPIYMNGGTLTALTATVGSAAQPIYLASGAITPLSATIGSSTYGTYLNNGVISRLDYYLQANIKSYAGSLSSGGWAALNGTSSSGPGPSIAVAHNDSAAAWNSGTHSSSLVWGHEGRRGLLDCSYNNPIVTFGGSSFEEATADAPKWYIKISGTSGRTYNLDKLPDFTGYYWANIKISTSSSAATTPTFNTCYTSNWFRSTGSTGWYSETYGGGIYMNDSTYIRIYNGKMLYSSGRMLSNSLQSSWIDGQKLTNAAYNVGDATNTDSYWPWMRQTNTSNGYWFSFGTLGTRFYWIGSPTSRTSNGYTHGMVYDISNGTLTAEKVYNAVWNDYAEFRAANTEEPGRVVIEGKFGVMTRSTERLQAGASIISDTFGHAMGETDECKTPIAVAGRALAYPHEDRDSYPLGAAVCTGPDGTVSLMTREEIMMYPERIVGTVSEIPTYETWGSGNIKVNGRIWIKVK